MRDKLYAFFLGTRTRSVLTGAAMFLAVSGSDYLLRNEISLDVFYFAPIALLTWSGSRRTGLAAAAAGVAVWLVDERIFAVDFADKYHVILWNALARMAFFLVVVFLVHQLKTLVQKERAISRLKSVMIHTVSHEFNNSLTGLSAGLFLLKELSPAPAGETKGKLYASMESALHNLELYVKNILNEARMEEGRFKVEMQPLTLRELARAAAAPMAELILQKGITLEMDIPESPLVVSADREALALVISNLLGNAVKYTRPGGRISVRIQPAGVRGERVVFAVDDSGIGISLEDLNRITGGFYRTREGMAEASGFGLGLRIANELLMLHGSRLEISSEKGKGSRFFFELPLLPAGKPAGGMGRES